MANQEQLDRLLEQGVQMWNEWRRKNPHVQIDLNGVSLRFANLSEAILNGTNLGYAQLWHTIFGDVDLSTVTGLETVRYLGPSTVGIDTIYLSQGKIPEAFLKGA